MEHSIDREKVIEALHCRAYDDDFPCWKCAYYKQDEKPVARCDYRGLMDDAIALLKGQEEKIKTMHIAQNVIADYLIQPEIVRCKDCKQGEQSVLPNRHLWCRIHEFYREPDWFCADGKRKET